MYVLLVLLQQLQLVNPHVYKQVSIPPDQLVLLAQHLLQLHATVDALPKDGTLEVFQLLLVELLLLYPLVMLVVLE